MPEKDNRTITPHRGGVFDDLLTRIKLIIRLMADSRVHPLLKIVPIVSFVYLLIPDLAPGPLDDAAILWVGSYLFVELCPPHVVEEHMRALSLTVHAQWRNSDIEDEEIVEGEFKEE
jgi:hypothetical protein